MIKEISAIQVFDSRGNPTVECNISTEKGGFRAIVPSGASTGRYEALELRDNEKAFLGKGVSKAISNINKRIAPLLKRKDETKQEEIDNLMLKLDGTDNKSELGANAILAVSMAVCRAGAASKNIPLYEYIAQISKRKKIMPCPAFNVINGGRHAGNNLDIQEYMILPTGARNFSEAMQIGSEIYHVLKETIRKEYGKEATNVGDEGGFAPPLNEAEEPLKLLVSAIKDSGYKGKVEIGLDVAASEFFKDGKYIFQGKAVESKELIDFYKKIIKKYPIFSIEDPFDQNDFDCFAQLTKEVGDETQIVGDDLLVTNPVRIKKAIQLKACNTLLLKVNQIGSVSEAIEAANLAFSNNWRIMVSHRSGETEDSFIADLAVGLGAQEIKSGATCRSERLSKYNQLLRIENALGKEVGFYNRKLLVSFF